MASPGIVEYVYLDAQAYAGESFNFSSKHLTILTKHLTSGRLKLVITDITRSEVHARIDKNLETEFTAVKNLQKNSRVLRSSPVAVSRKSSNALWMLAATRSRSSVVKIGAGEINAHYSSQFFGRRGNALDRYVTALRIRGQEILRDLAVPFEVGPALPAQWEFASVPQLIALTLVAVRAQAKYRRFPQLRAPQPAA